MSSKRILLALDVLVNGPPVTPPSLIPVRRAQLCVEETCKTVFDLADATRCPVCSSDSVAVATLTRDGDLGNLWLRASLAKRGRKAFAIHLERVKTDEREKARARGRR